MCLCVRNGLSELYLFMYLIRIQFEFKRRPEVGYVICIGIWIKSFYIYWGLLNPNLSPS